MSLHISYIIIQQNCGQKLIVIRHPYMIDILQHEWVDQVATIRPRPYIALPRYSISSCKIFFVEYLLHYKIIILHDVGE